MGELTEKKPFTPSFLTPGGRVRTPFPDGSNPSIEEISKSVPLIRTEEQLVRARELLDLGQAKDLQEAAEIIYKNDASTPANDAHHQY